MACFCHYNIFAKTHDHAKMTVIQAQALHNKYWEISSLLVTSKSITKE